MLAICQPGDGRQPHRKLSRPTCAVVVEEVEKANLAIRLRRERISLVRPEVQQHDLAGVVATAVESLRRRAMFNWMGGAGFAEKPFGEALDVPRCGGTAN